MRTFSSDSRSGFLTRLGAFSAAAILGVATLFLVSPAAPAIAHDQLTGVQVVSSDSGEATALKLSFSDNVLEVGTEVNVTDATGADATSGTPTHSGRDVLVPLASPLADGSYSAVWRVVSSDGHPIEGGFSFDIGDGTAGEIRSLDEGTEDHDHDHDTGSTVDQPNMSLFAPFIGIGVGLAAIVVIAALIMRRRKNAISRDTSRTSPDQE